MKRRPLQRLLGILAVLSLVALVIVILLWGRSRWHQDEWVFDHGLVFSSDGEGAVTWWRPKDPFKVITIRTPGGTAHAVAFTGSTAALPFHVSVQYWLLSAELLMIPALWLLVRFNPIRARRGHCPVCGYDLRATPGRCPECGTVTAAGPGAATPGS